MSPWPPGGEARRERPSRTLPRRSVLAGGSASALLALGGCGVFQTPTTPAVPDAIAGAVARLRAQEEHLVRLYRRAQRAGHSGTGVSADALASYLADHQAHLQALRRLERLTSRSTTSASTSASPAAEPALAKQPERARKALAAAERAQRGRAARLAQRASGNGATLLASLAASEAVHAALLAEAESP